MICETRRRRREMAMTTIAESVHMFLLYQISRGGVKQKKNWLYTCLCCWLVYSYTSKPVSFFIVCAPPFWLARLLPAPLGAYASACIRLRFISSRESKTCGSVAVIERQAAWGPDPTTTRPLSVFFFFFLLKKTREREKSHVANGPATSS